MSRVAMHTVNTDTWLNMKALIIAGRLGHLTAAYEWHVNKEKNGPPLKDLRVAVGAQVSEMELAQMEAWLQRFDEDKRENQRRREPYFHTWTQHTPRVLNADPVEYGIACPACGWRNPTRHCQRCADRRK